MCAIVCVLISINRLRAVSLLSLKVGESCTVCRFGLLNWRKSNSSWTFFHILWQSSFVNITHIIVGHTHPIKLSGTNASLLCSWSSVVTHDVTSRHACHRMTLNLPSHNSVMEVAILTPVQDIPSACSLKQSGHPEFWVQDICCQIKVSDQKSNSCLINVTSDLMPCWRAVTRSVVISGKTYPFTDCLFLKTQRMKTL